MKRALLVAAAAVLLTACGPSVKVTPLTDWNASPSTGEVDVYLSSAEVGQTYFEIAQLTADDNSMNLPHKLKGRIIEKARELGADGIIIMSKHEEKAGRPKLRGTMIVPPAEKNVMEAIAIVYR